ncbi:alkaline phosphatase family protein [Vibrio bathopelagicus]
MPTLRPLALGLAAFSVAPVLLANEPTQPKLILQITVDALRGDLPERYRDNMGEGGFNYLLDHGLHYANAHYQHSNTETIVGHAALATGAPPSVNGMVGNVWFDRQMERKVYNIEDVERSELSADIETQAAVEIDDTQAVAVSSGRSPVNIKSSTFSDELVKASNGQSRSFAVSFKDRGAVPLAGELGKAFWFSKSTGGFVTSDYYYDSYPDWVTDWNKQDFIQQYSNQRWELLKPREEYLFAQEGDVSFKTEIATFQRSFPYPFGPASFPYFTTMLSLSPAADDIVADFAKSLISKEQLGKGEFTDYLSVSFSATDYVIHANGPSSLETEDTLLRLDRTFADLFSYVDDYVGLENTLIVLSADHGAPDSPSYITNHGSTEGHYFGTNTLEKSGTFEKAKARFGVGDELFEAFENPNFYLDHKVIQQHKLDLSEVQQFLSQELNKIEGIEFAFTANAIETGRLPNTRIAALVENNYYPSRSGDLYLVFNPGVYINEFDSLSVASVHGSPWRYDTHVPVIFAGNGIKGHKIYQEVAPYDIAPTLSAILGIAPPSGSTGQVLLEPVE